MAGQDLMFNLPQYNVVQNDNALANFRAAEKHEIGVQNARQGQSDAANQRFAESLQVLGQYMDNGGDPRNLPANVIAGLNLNDNPEDQFDPAQHGQAAYDMYKKMQAPKEQEFVTVNGQRVPANQGGDFRTPEKPPAQPADVQSAQYAQSVLDDPEASADMKAWAKGKLNPGQEPTAKQRDFDHFLAMANDQNRPEAERKLAMAQLEKSGFRLSTDKDGNTTFVMGPGAGADLTVGTQGKLQMVQFGAKKAREAGERLLEKMEGAGATEFGAVGAAREAVAGIAGQIGMESVSEALAPDDMLDMRYHARNTFGQIVQIVTGDSSGRYSDQDAKRAREALGVLEATKDRRAAVRAVKTLLEFTEMVERQASTFGQGDQQDQGDSPPVEDLVKALQNWNPNG